jgi:WD40 repeat protein
MMSCLSAYGVTLEKLTVLKDHKEEVNYIAFSPDGKLMATSSEDNMVFIWDTSKWMHTGTLPSEDEPLAVAFGKDGKDLFIVDHDNILSKWELETGTRRTNAKLGCAVNDLNISPDGKTLAVACDGKRILIWSVAENVLMKTLVGHSNDVMSLAFSADGSRLASGGKKRELIIWDTAEWKQLQLFNEHSEDIAAVAFSPGGEQVAAGSFDNKVVIWDLKSGGKRTELTKHAEEGDRAIAWRPSGGFLISTDRKPSPDPKVQEACETIAWNAETGAIQASAPVGCEVNYLGISPDGKTVVVVGNDITVYSIKE